MIGFGIVMSLITSVVMTVMGASAAYAIPDRTTEIALASVQRAATCDLTITKAMSPNPLVPNQPATVTLTVTNVGTAPCLNRPLTGPIFLPGGTYLSDVKPTGLTFTSPPVATPATGWSCSLASNGTASCFNPAVLPAGYTATFTINATVTASSGTVTNCGRIFNSTDTNSANNESCVTRQVA